MNNRGISIEQAQHLLQKAAIHGKQLTTAPLTFAILDNGGHLKAFASDDNSGIHRSQIAQGKANAALGMGFNTSEMQSLIQESILPQMFATCISASVAGGFIPLAGGVLIYDKGNLLGAIGISGASSVIDEKVAQVAIADCALQANI